METMPITREGHEKLKKELESLINVERPANVKAIEEARAHGDLSENAEYHAAKDRQAQIQSRIQELQIQLGKCDIIEAEGPFDKAIFGATVTVTNVDTGEEQTYLLVGPYESAPEKGRLSVLSPLGRALIGKEEGDEVKVKTPKGMQELEITSIL
jgi:transcription elongation factor GreA